MKIDFFKPCLELLNMVLHLNLDNSFAGEVAMAGSYTMLKSMPYIEGVKSASKFYGTLICRILPNNSSSPDLVVSI